MAMRIPLYLRIWIAVVVAVALVTLAFGWLWRLNAQINAEERPPLREVVVRNAAGETVGQMRGRPVVVPGEGVEFPIAMNDGSSLVVQFPPRPRSGAGRPPPRPWLRGNDGLLWMLGIAALAVALGSYPIVRQLTRRLDALRAGVERWGEGDLSARVDESGSDEAAFLARRFNRAADRIERLVLSHKTLLANASHELRTPLARIRMGLELMGTQPGASLVRAEIERDIEELDELVGEILLASRLDAPNADIGPTEIVDLTGLAAEEAARSGAELLDTPGGQSVVVEGHARLLRRAIRNLLENARRYGGDGPVTVDVRGTDGQATVAVNDHGPGVPSALRERIFEPFYRLPGASEQSGGVGLGLALVRSIAQRHGGTVRCEDSPQPPGARFVLSVPLRS